MINIPPKILAHVRKAMFNDWQREHELHPLDSMMTRLFCVGLKELVQAGYQVKAPEDSGGHDVIQPYAQPLALVRVIRENMIRQLEDNPQDTDEVIIRRDTCTVTNLLLEALEQHLEIPT